MASAPVTKYQVMAKCIQIMTNQMRDSRNPEMKRRLREKIDYFSSIGVVDNYQMIVYRNSVMLLHNDYRNYPNLNLFEGGQLYVGAFDDMLALHDSQCIRIHGNGKADSGSCVHGYIEGDCVTESVEREKGKEVKYEYQSNNPYAALLKGGKCVNNATSLPIIKRLFKNETVGQGDFFKFLLVVIALAVLVTETALEFLLIPLGIALVYITYKRIKDLGYTGGKAIVLLVLCYMLHVIGFIILCAMPTAVVSAEEYKKAEEMMNEKIASAQKTLKARCSTFNGSIDWLLMNAETLRIANSLSGGKSGMTSMSHNQSDANQGYPDDEEERREEERRQREEEAERLEEERRQREEEQERREEERRQQQISNLESQIRSLESRISSLQHVASSAESQATSRRQQGETYLSYANSAQDDDLRNDYLQSADSCFSEASHYESEAASAQSEISSLQSEVDSLQSEIYNL